MAPEDAIDTASAGALLRAAREKQGLHIAALAAAMKVTPRKLEALECDRLEELDGVIFTRALAQSMCRALRIDAKPVLALLPQPEAMPLGHVSGSLNTPFRERGSRDDRPLVHTAQRVLVIGAVLLMAAAGLLFVLPLSSWRTTGVSQEALLPSPPTERPSAGTKAPSAGSGSEAAAAVAASAPAPAPMPAPSPSTIPVTDPAAAAQTGLQPVPASSAVGGAGVMASAQVPSTAGSAPGSGTPTAARASPLQITASAVTWVEVRERGGRVLMSRLLAAGESIGLDGAFPLQATIGNAASTQVRVHGRVIDLTSATRDNVARLEVAGDLTR